jgi:hypothetical protein
MSVKEKYKGSLEICQKNQHWTLGDRIYKIFSNESKINIYFSNGRVWYWSHVQINI